MNCTRCGGVAIAGLTICRACRSQAVRVNRIKNEPLVKAGYCHAGTRITPIPSATLAKIARMRREEQEREANAQAEAIRRVQVQVSSFFDEIAEELAEMANRPKTGLQGCATCPDCKRKLVDGVCYRCRK